MLEFDKNAGATPDENEYRLMFYASQKVSGFSFIKND